jgi:hypothetical protein
MTSELHRPAARRLRFRLRAERRAEGRAAGPLPADIVVRVRLSADLLAASLEVDRRRCATLDDIERADAVADRLLRRQAERRTGAR